MYHGAKQRRGMNTAKRRRLCRNDALSHAIQRISDGCARHNAVGIDDEKVVVMSDRYKLGGVVSMLIDVVDARTIVRGKNDGDSVATLDMGVGPFVCEAEEELSAGAEIYSSDELGLGRVADIKDEQAAEFGRCRDHHCTYTLGSQENEREVGWL